MKNSNNKLFATVFITGAAVLIIELAAVRILSPIYGSSLYVLSSVLTVILGALSVGYWYGGKMSDREHSIDTLYSIITISGLSVLTLSLLSGWLLPTYGPELSTAAGPLVFSLILFFIPAFLLGIVSPYIIKLQSVDTKIEKIGAVVGATFFWGTFGSIFGSLATGFILIPHLGVTRTIVLVSLTLVALGIMMPLFSNRPLNKKRVAIFLVATSILCTSLYLQNMNINESFVYAEDGIYSSIKIKDTAVNKKTVRALLRDTNNSSAVILNSKELVAPYTKFTLLYKSLVPNSKNILILGGGAYTTPRTLTHRDPSLKIDVVEIEPGLFNLSKEYFDLSDTTNIRNYPMDARVFLRQTREKKYDVIFTDVFGTDQAPPFHLTTTEFYSLLRNNLSEDGVLILNIIGKPDSSQPSLIGSITKTVKNTFANTIAYRFDPNTSAFQNVILIARASEKPINPSAWDIKTLVGTVYEQSLEELDLEQEILLTDDYSPIEYLMLKQS